MNIDSIVFPGLLFIIGYLIGSIPFGLILARFSGHGDIRKIGSGNIGATNVLRTGNKKLAVATLLMDIGKGVLAVLTGSCIGNIVSVIGHSPSLQLTTTLAAAFGAVIGHCYPIWLKFKGGKGVATALGVFLAAVPIAGLAACCAWLITAFASKTSSLSALVAVLVAPIVTFFIYGPAPATIALLITALIFWRHKDNIKRLMKGEEPTVSFKKAN